MRKHILPVTVVLLAAFALRTLGLAVAPVGPDEAAHISLALLPLEELIPLNQIWVRTEPPLAALMLRPWLAVTGISTFTARYLSALIGLLGLAGGAAAARALLRSPRMAALAVGALAIFPTALIASRTAGGRVWAISGVLLLAAVIATPHHRVTLGRWMAACAAAAMALGGSLLMLPAGVLLLVAAGGWRKAFSYAAAQMAALLLWLPYLWPLRATLREGFTNPRYIPDVAARTLTDFPAEVLAGMAIGPVGQPAVRYVVMGGIALVALVGLASMPRRARTLTVTLWGGLVLAALGLLQVVGYAPPELVLPGTLALALGVGAGLSQFSRRHTGAWGLIVVGCVGIAATQTLFASPEPNLRPVAQRFAQRAQPGDAVLFSQPWEAASLALARPDLARDLLWVPDTFLDAEPTLSPLIAEQRRIWEVTYEGGVQSQSNRSGQYLLDNAAWDGGTLFDEADTELSLFVPPGQAVNAGGERTCYQLDVNILTVCVAPFRLPGFEAGYLPFEATWVLNEAVFTTYSAFVEVVPTDGSQAVRRIDLIITNQQLSFTSFPVGQPVPDVFLPDLTGLPPGIYELRFGVYNPRSGAQVLVDGGPADTIPLGSIVLIAPN